MGPEGPEGPPGPPGPVGPVGPPGPVGPAGPLGPLGPPGPEGPLGPAGPAGPVGAVGPLGLDGPVGPEGPEGPEGPDGVCPPPAPISKPTPSAQALSSKRGIAVAHSSARRPDRIGPPKDMEKSPCSSARSSQRHKAKHGKCLRLLGKKPIRLQKRNPRSLAHPTLRKGLRPLRKTDEGAAKWRKPRPPLRKKGKAWGAEPEKAPLKYRHPISSEMGASQRHRGPSTQLTRLRRRPRVTGSTRCCRKDGKISRLPRGAKVAPGCCRPKNSNAPPS